MFYKMVNYSGKRFNLVLLNIFYEPYEIIVEIVSNPKMIMKGKFFEFR